MRKLIKILIIGIIITNICYSQENRELIDKNEEDQDKVNAYTEIVNSIGLKLRLIPTGSFLMGGDLENEMPRHVVHITKSFYVGVYEVTQEQYDKVMSNNPADNKNPNLPAGNITWNDATEFCRKLSLMTGDKYRLPTEAEWEYAARGGLVQKEYVWGDQEIPIVNGLKQANVPDETCRPKLREDKIFQGYVDGFEGIAPVGSFAPNGFGLYDMAGNVWERCSDWYDENYYKYSPEKDPPGPASGERRVLRGGGYWFHRNNLRVAYRCGSPLDRAGDNDGFRVVRQVK